MLSLNHLSLSNDNFSPVSSPSWERIPESGLFHGVGFNSAGMMLVLGGGCGDQLAKWVVRGRPELDMYGYDVRRFCPAVSQTQNTSRVNQRSHESYVQELRHGFCTTTLARSPTPACSTPRPASRRTSPSACSSPAPAPSPVPIAAAVAPVVASIAVAVARCRRARRRLERTALTKPASS